MDFTQAGDIALLIGRVALGLTIFAHGANKLKGGLDGTAGWFSGIGLRPGKLHAVLAIWGEIISGLLLAVGLLTSFAALGIVGLMVSAGWLVHRNNGFFIIKEGWEYTFILAVFAVVIAMLGPGGISVDSLLDVSDDMDEWTGLILSAGGGVSAAVLLLAIFYHPSRTDGEDATGGDADALTEATGGEATGEVAGAGGETAMGDRTAEDS